MPQIPKIVSVDDQVIEPPNVWTDRVPARYRDVGPRVIDNPMKRLSYVGGVLSWEEGRPGDDGPMCSWWYFEDLHYPMVRTHVAVGYPLVDAVRNLGRGVGQVDREVGCVQRFDVRQGCVRQESEHVADRAGRNDATAVPGSRNARVNRRLAGRCLALGRLARRGHGRTTRRIHAAAEYASAQPV